MKLLGISGGMGSGKSTAIEVIKSIPGIGRVEVLKFARPLYDIQEYAYNRISSIYKRPESFTKDRVFLQWLGTEWSRNTISESIWVDIWTAEYKRLVAQGTDLVISDDTRFINEAERVRSLGGTVIRLDRPQNIAHAIGGEGIKNHASEVPLPPSLCDYIILNDSTIEAFQDSLCKVIDQIRNATQGEK